MAKKALGFNMAEEVRNLLQEDKTLSGKQVYTALQKKFPSARINPNSCGVAFSGARKALGIGGTRAKTVRKRKPAAAAAAAGGGVSFDTLRAAKELLAQCDGNSDVAVASIKQLTSLQIG